MRRALQAHQKALDVTGHNIANAATPGYVRQQAMLEVTRPYTPPGVVRLVRPGQIGTGVEATRVRRIFDGFIEGRIRLANSALGYWDEKKAALEQVEAAFNDPSDIGFGDSLSRFWNAWQELSKRPESDAVRAVLIEEAGSFCAILNRTATQLETTQQELEAAFRAKVTEANSLAHEVAELNEEITKIKVTGNEPNDLMDKRDAAIRRLSELMDVSVYEDRDGALTIEVGGEFLVRRDTVHELDIQAFGPVNSVVVWAHNREAVAITGGEIAGVREARDILVPKYYDKLNEIARTVIDKVNELHKTGYGIDELNTHDIDFFVGNIPGSEARHIAVNPVLVADPRKIGAARPLVPGDPVAPGDGTVAGEIAALKDKLLMESGRLTIGGFYSETIVLLGNDSETAERMAEVEELTLHQNTSRKESFSGVSVDEELANVMRYQHAYNACARMVSVIDEMLDVLINRTGVTGL
ncbi:MAG TPA: flagellar hook-associated protein FlgK [Firmicutes bacterium]|nr:flagellar hook-associated protein FlgK [Bacillota bacterium]